MDAPEQRAAQKVLADTLVAFVHGEQAVEEVKRSAAVLFGGSIEGVSDTELLSIFAEVPSTSIASSALNDMQVLDLFVAAQAVKSKGEGRRLIKNGGAYVNNSRVEELDAAIPRDRDVIILRTGKKSYYLVQVTNG